MSRTVSVVISAHDAATTIDAALASVVSQTRLPDEVVVVDDASDDDTAAVAARWSDRLPMVVERRSSNGGCGVARRQAIARATGDLVAPLDADDIWMPDHLAAVVPLAVTPDVVVGVRRLRWQPGREPAAACELWQPRPGSEGIAILRGNLLFSGSVAWRSTIQANGGWGEARRVDDWETWIRLLAHGGCRLVWSPRPTVLYRSSPTSLSAADACLPDEIALCARLLAEPWPNARQRRALRATERRIRARLRLVDAFAQAADGDERRARRTFAHAAIVDRSFYGWTRPGELGSVTLRAGVGAVSPQLAARRRAERLASKSLGPEPDGAHGAGVHAGPEAGGRPWMC